MSEVQIGTLRYLDSYLLNLTDPDFLEKERQRRDRESALFARAKDLLSESLPWERRICTLGNPITGDSHWENETFRTKTILYRSAGSMPWLLTLTDLSHIATYRQRNSAVSVYAKSMSEALNFSEAQRRTHSITLSPSLETVMPLFYPGHMILSLVGGKLMGLPTEGPPPIEAAEEIIELFTLTEQTIVS